MAGDDARRPVDPVPVGRLRRTAPLAGMAARTAGEAVVAALRKRSGGDTSEFHARTAERYAELLGRSKGVLMKAGQMFSFVGGVVPDEQRAVYQAAMGRLQADAPPMPYRMAADMFEAELGRRPEDVFADFGPEPVAAASIGQVHAARLPDGRRVAVKIQYPGVEAAIRADLDNTELLATFFGLVRTMMPSLSRMDVRAVAREIADRIGEEVDYRQEAANQQEFADIYRGHPFIHVPGVVTELSTRRVLTQEYVDGLRWADALQAEARLRDRWGEVIYRFAIGSLRRKGLFNADPHPGNYLFHEDGSVSFVDFGCVKRFPLTEVGRMKNLVRAMVWGDKEGVHRHFVELGMFPAEGEGGPTADEVYQWYRGGFELFTAPQPYTMDPTVVAAAQAREFDPAAGSGRVLRAMSPPADWTFLSRIDLGVMSVLAELRATGWWESIRAEIDDEAPPLTELGIAEAPFWAGAVQST